MRRVLRVGSGVFAGVAVMLGFGVLPASAYAVDSFTYNNTKLCTDLPWPLDHQCWAMAKGFITWGQRTASLDVTLWNQVPDRGYATVHFTAFAGTKQIDSLVLYGAAQGTAYNDIPIGDPNLRGGIDRIRTQVCWTGDRDADGDYEPRFCGPQWNDIRD